jgi:hypothetical protein
VTRDEAIIIRSRQINGEPIHALQLQEAIHVIQSTTPMGSNPGRGGRPHKFRLPVLTQADRDRMNGTLLFNLGREAGRALA